MSTVRPGKVTMTIDRSRLDAIVMASMNAGVGSAGVRLQRIIKGSMTKTSRGVSSPPGSPPSRQTDRLYNSIAVSKPDRGRVQVYTDAPYARIMEDGGTFTSKGKLFTIPLSKEATLLRANVSDLKTLNLSLIRSKSGKLLLVREQKTRSRPLFVLKRTIRIAARPFLRPAVRNPDNLQKIAKAFVGGFKRELRRGFRVAITGVEA